MLKLTPLEIQIYLSQIDDCFPGAETLKIQRQALADHAAEHAARGIYQFATDWYKLPDGEFMAKYNLGHVTHMTVALRLWFKSQDVEV